MELIANLPVCMANEWRRDVLELQRGLGRKMPVLFGLAILHNIYRSLHCRLQNHCDASLRLQQPLQIIFSGGSPPGICLELKIGRDPLDDAQHIFRHAGEGEFGCRFMIEFSQE